jgi:spore maturation protein CgeB
MTGNEAQAEGTRSQAAASAVGVRRFANDEIARVGGRFSPDESSTLDFLCECGNLGCNALVKITLAEYRQSAAGSVASHH